MGGSDENKTVLDSGEKYDPDSNTWTPIPPMLQVSSSPCSCSAPVLVSLASRRLLELYVLTHIYLHF